MTSCQRSGSLTYDALSTGAVVEYPFARVLDPSLLGGIDGHTPLTRALLLDVHEVGPFDVLAVHPSQAFDLVLTGADPELVVTVLRRQYQWVDQSLLFGAVDWHQTQLAIRVTEMIAEKNRTNIFGLVVGGVDPSQHSVALHPSDQPSLARIEWRLVSLCDRSNSLIMHWLFYVRPKWI